VRVESTPGKGSRFIVTLPVTPPSGPTAESADVALASGMKET
jgi:hypothetical protein